EGGGRNVTQSEIDAVVGAHDPSGQQREAFARGRTSRVGEKVPRGTGRSIGPGDDPEVVAGIAERRAKRAVPHESPFERREERPASSTVATVGRGAFVTLHPPLRYSAIVGRATAALVSLATALTVVAPAHATGGVRNGPWLMEPRTDAITLMLERSVPGPVTVR